MTESVGNTNKVYQMHIASLDDLDCRLKTNVPSWMTSLSLQQTYVIEFIISQCGSKPSSHTVSDSYVVLTVSLLQVADLIRIDAEV